MKWLLYVASPDHWTVVDLAGADDPWAVDTPLLVTDGRGVDLRLRAEFDHQPTEAEIQSAVAA